MARGKQRFRVIDLKLSEDRLRNSITAAEEFLVNEFPNAHLELAIIIVLAYEEGPVLDSRALAT